ncbi:hypothetical protein V5O48_015194 [Marasmius crinis-equi]|uniref:Glycoside hydrolase family 76 protein n=1 Tax=Marasmius crinis-equi TaxID=585013 RepID=A0ABR3EV70_9AGAR
MHVQVTLIALATLVHLRPAAPLDFFPNGVWNSNVTQLSPDRLDIALAALVEGVNRLGNNEVYNVFDTLSFGNPQLFAALANFEHRSKNNGTFYALTSQYLNGYPSHMSTIRESIYWGYAFIRLYKARGDNTFREAAIRLWESVYQDTIFNQTMASMARSKILSVPSNCTSTAPYSTLSFVIQGATFLVRFSALLAESDPLNSTYLHAATESVNFTLPFLQGGGGSLGLPDPGVHADAIPCPPVSLNFPQGTSTAGFMIEALAILSSVAKSEDMVATLNQALTSTLEWTLERMSSGKWFGLANGILPNTFRPSIDNGTTGGFNDEEDGDMYFLRGLATSLRLGGKLPADLRDTIKIVMGIHYNAIRDYAKFAENLYDRSWLPGVSNSSSFDMYNQAAAAQILVDGIDLLGPDTPRPSPSSHSQPRSSHPRAGIIAGATIGSVIFVSISAGVVFVFLHRHRWRRAAPLSEITSQWISPFYGEKSGPGQLHSRGSHWRMKDRSGLPVSPDLRGTGAGPAPLVVPASLEGTPTSRSYRHREDGLGLAEADPDTSREDRREGTATQTEMAPGFPDMVRAVYQRLWERDGSEAPPDYRSDEGTVQGLPAAAGPRDL